MNTSDQLNLFCFMLGFVTGASCTMFVWLYIDHYHKSEMKRQGERLLEKMIAQKQVDFFFNEAATLFVMANQAASADNMELFNKLVAQHATATKRFEQARINLLQLEQQ